MTQGSCLRRARSEEIVEFKKYQAEIIKLRNSNEELKQSNVVFKQNNVAFKQNIAELKQTNVALKQNIAELKQTNVTFKKRNAELEAEVAELKRQIALLQKELYGRKSERKKHAPKIPKIDKTRTESHAGGRKPLPENLERETILHDIPTEEKKCPSCGIDLQEMPSVVTEQLAFRPAKLYVKRHERKQYVCPKCHEIIKTAKLPDQPIDKGLPDAALLTEVVINKYQDALPLYSIRRQVFLPVDVN